MLNVPSSKGDLLAGTSEDFRHVTDIIGNDSDQVTHVIHS